MVDSQLLGESLQAFYADDPDGCEKGCRAILDRQDDHPLGNHLLAWSFLEREKRYDNLLDNLLTSPETPRAKGIPAKATTGWLLWSAGRTREAIKALTENLSREPKRQDLQTLLGICLLTDDQPAPAAQLLRSVVSRSPNNPVPRFHLAHALLHLGNWDEGWAELERSRFDLPCRQPGQYDHCPERLWTGQDLTGKSIMIEGEQGYGDQIQFIRFAEWLKKRYGAGEVHFSCHPALANLMQSVEFLDSAAGKVYRDFDYHVPVMSLPHRCKAQVTDSLYPGAYLKADPDSLQKWRGHLPRISPRPRIGICWRSAPMASRCEKNKVDGINFVKNRKSLGIDGVDYLLRCLKGKADIISLQLSPTDEERDRLVSANAHLPDIKNFTDTAAIVELCDDVITIDTAIAHLAGALGANTRVLLAKGADWRWAMEIDHKSAWYPGTEMHRQDSEWDWGSAIDSATGRLAV